MHTSPDPVADDSGTAWDEWESFRKLGQLVNHWDRPGWGPHTRSYHWFITFQGADDLKALTEKCQDQLRELPTLDLVPPELLHLTIKRAAFTDEISVDEAMAIARAAEPRLAQLSPIASRIGPLTGSSGAVRFSVAPHGALADVRTAVTTAIAEVRGSGAAHTRRSTYIPHVSIAYSNATTPAAPTVARVELLRSLGSVPARIGRVDLVELRREEHRYVWESLAELPLTGSA